MPRATDAAFYDGGPSSSYRKVENNNLDQWRLDAGHENIEFFWFMGNIVPNRQSHRLPVRNASITSSLIVSAVPRGGTGHVILWWIRVMALEDASPDTLSNVCNISWRDTRWEDKNYLRSCHRGFNALREMKKNDVMEYRAQCACPDGVEDICST